MLVGSSDPGEPRAVDRRIVQGPTASILVRYFRSVGRTFRSLQAAVMTGSGRRSITFRPREPIDRTRLSLVTGLASAQSTSGPERFDHRWSPASGTQTVSAEAGDPVGTDPSDEGWRNGTIDSPGTPSCTSQRFGPPPREFRRIRTVRLSPTWG